MENENLINLDGPKVAKLQRAAMRFLKPLPIQGFRKIWFEPKFQLTPVVFNF